MINKLWGWLAAAGAAMLAALYYMAGQRDKARSNERQARNERQMSESARATENKIREAQQQARANAVETEKQRDERPKAERPSGSLRRD